MKRVEVSDALRESNRASGTERLRSGRGNGTDVFLAARQATLEIST